MERMSTILPYFRLIIANDIYNLPQGQILIPNPHHHCECVKPTQRNSM